MEITSKQSSQQTTDEPPYHPMLMLFLGAETRHINLRDKSDVAGISYVSWTQEKSQSEPTSLIQYRVA